MAMKSIDAGVLPGGRAVSRARLPRITPPSAYGRQTTNGNGALGCCVASASRHVAGALHAASVPPRTTNIMELRRRGACSFPGRGRGAPRPRQRRMSMNELPPMPRIRRTRTKRGGRLTDMMPPCKDVVADRNETDRIVHWRFDEAGNATGWCANCHTQHRAVELRWRPDRVAFGKFKQGTWECRTCYPQAGRYDVIGLRPK